MSLILIDAFRILTANFSALNLLGELDYNFQQQIRLHLLLEVSATHLKMPGLFKPSKSVEITRYEYNLKFIKGSSLIIHCFV